MLAAKLHQRRRHALTKGQHVMCTLFEATSSRFHSIPSPSRLSFSSCANYGDSCKGRGVSRGFNCSQSNYKLGLPSLDRHPLRNCRSHNRCFSKFSTDSNEAVAQDLTRISTPASSPNTPLPSPLFDSEDGSTNKSRSSIDYMKPATIQMKHLLSLKQSYLTLSKACLDAQSLLNSNVNASSPDELVAMADYFLILVNDVDLESSIDTIQTLQYNEDLNDGEDSVTKEVLGQATRVLCRLHSVFLRVVESCVPPMANYTDNSTATVRMEHSSGTFVQQTTSKYSAMTMGRALQVSRRAEELGMPMHKPLYQRMAVGIVLTSAMPCRHPAGRWPWEDQNSAQENNNDEMNSNDPKLELPHSRQIKEGIYTPPPLAMEILNLCHRAKVALKCSFFPSMPLNKQMEQSRQQHQLEIDMYSEPWLLLLKRRQFEEALGLLRGWESNFGITTSIGSQNKPKINLLSLLEEDTISKALEIAKDWVEGTSFPENVSSDPHANELIDLLQHSLAAILRRRKIAAAEMAKLINALAAMHRTRPQEEEDGDEEFSDLDSEEEDFEEFHDFEDYDSDDDGEEDEDIVLGELRNDVTAENFPLFLKGVGLDTDAGTRSTNPNAGGANFNSQQTVEEEENDNDEPPLIHGISNDDVRRSIYLRKGPDWELPDIVSQLEGWNKGQPLSFTPEFERYLGWQLSQEDDDDHYG